MSPEAIFELKFTTESDVWSYGVLMYELFSWGRCTYRTDSFVLMTYIDFGRVFLDPKQFPFPQVEVPILG